MQITIFSLAIFAAMIFQFTIDYLRHRLTANSRHGTHSPFVYKLVDEVIYDFSNKKVYDDIEAQRKKLLNDDSLITIADLGATSVRNKKVSEVAKNLKTPHLVQLIYRLVANLKPTNMIELGTSLGITSSYLAKAQPTAQLLTIEEYPQVAAIAMHNFKDLALNHIELKVGNFNKLLLEQIEQLKKLDFVHVNGSHTKENILNYFNWCLPKIHENSLLIFDDIYQSEEMKEAWKEIKDHPHVTVTIDLFWLGLVYFRKGQAKEHFKIKF